MHLPPCARARAAGGRGEAATYDEGDQDDVRLAKDAARQVASKSLQREENDDDDDDDEDSDEGAAVDGEGNKKKDSRKTQVCVCVCVDVHGVCFGRGTQ